ncbi:MAG: Crp/Fnr family transcriptional regulator [Robiginitomaculum sp.]|nr:MAG: Crp/Fnr family transcriptional regulator [Robiginitomaculum sp.]
MSDLSLLPAPIAEQVRQAGQTVMVPADTPVFHMGDECSAFIMVLRGQVRVQQLSEAGRELILYRIHAGESCVITTACLLSSEPYPVEAITEEETMAAFLPRAAFEVAFAANPAFRQSVFATYGQRMAQMMGLLAELAFERLETRLARHLLDHAGDGNRVNLTQARLAAELGAAREAVNRRLSAWQKQGLVHLGRGHIELCDKPGLAALTRPAM